MRHYVAAIGFDELDSRRLRTRWSGEQKNDRKGEVSLHGQSFTECD